MVSPPHEIPLEILRDQPTLLPELLRALGVGEIGSGLVVADATLRQADPAEVHPDLVLDIGDGQGWALIELQLSPDAAKQRRWPLMVSLQFDQRKTMGDLIVLTPHRRVADWARGLVAVRGRLGTELMVRPVVVHISDHNVDLLLSEAHPELAFFAAWAMHHRYGPRAHQVVQAALELAEHLPPADQPSAARAIFHVLNPRLVSQFREVMMLDPSRFPENHAMRALREELEAIGEARGEARGKAIGEATGEARGQARGARGMAKALLLLLQQRGIALPDGARQHITDCTDLDALDGWITRAADATTLEQVLGSD